MADSHRIARDDLVWRARVTPMQSRLRDRSGPQREGVSQYQQTPPPALRKAGSDSTRTANVGLSAEFYHYLLAIRDPVSSQARSAVCSSLGDERARTQRRCHRCLQDDRGSIGHGGHLSQVKAPLVLQNLEAVFFNGKLIIPFFSAKLDVNCTYCRANHLK